MTPSQNFETDQEIERYVDLESSGEKQQPVESEKEIILARERVNDPSEFVDDA